MFTAPHTTLEKTFGQMPDIEFSDLRQFSILRLNIFWIWWRGFLEFDCPSHFLASGETTGATLLKRRFLSDDVVYWYLIQ